jgi:hypothetical protein
LNTWLINEPCILFWITILVYEQKTREIRLLSGGHHQVWRQKTAVCGVPKNLERVEETTGTKEETNRHESGADISPPRDRLADSPRKATPLFRSADAKDSVQ